MRLLSLQIHRMPGLDDAFAIEWDPGINLIVGPNGSGKTSLCRAVRALLWETAAPRLPFAAAATWEQAGVDWRVEREGKSRPRWQRAAEPSDPPPLPGPQTRALYRLGVLDLCKPDADSDDRRLAREVLIQLAGGYNLDALLDEVYGEKPRAGIAERGKWQQAHDAVVAMRRRHAALAAREDRLGDLRRELAESRVAAERLEVWHRARSAAAARRDLAAAEAVAAGFPAALAATTGGERERLEALDEELAELAKRDEEIARELAAAETRIRAANLAHGPLQPDALAATEERIGALERCQHEHDELVREREAAAARLAEAGRALDPAWRGEAARPVAPTAVAAAAAHLREASSLRARRDQLEVLLRHEALSVEEPAGDARTIDRQVDLLQNWLALPHGRGGGWPLALGVVAAVALAATGAVLIPRAAHPGGWLLAAGGGGLLLAQILVALRRDRRQRRERQALADRYAALAPDRTPDWRGPAVRAALAALRAEAAAHTRQRIQRELRRLLAAEANAAERSLADCDARLPELAARLGAAPSLGEVDLVEFGRRVAAYQQRREEHAAAVRAVEVVAERRRELQRQLTDFCVRHGVPPPEDVAAVRARFRDLRARSESLREAERAAASARQDAHRLQDQRAQRLAERARLAQRLGCATDDEGEIARRLRLLPDFQAARQEVERQRVLTAERDAALAQVVADTAERNALASCDELDLQERIAEDEPLAARRDALLQEAAAIERDLEAARSGTDLERASAEATRAREALAACCFDQQHNDLARLILHRIQAEHDARQAPALLARADRLFTRFTRGRYRLERPVRGTQEPAFRAFDTERESPLALTELSDGTRAQLLLAARVAYLAEVESAVTLPLFLDEALTVSDPERFAAVAESLILLAKEQDRQIVYLTCDPRDARAWQEALARSGAAPAREIDLAKRRRLAVAAPATDLAAARVEPVPAAQGHDAVSYGRALDVARLDPWGTIGRVPLYYLLRDDLALLESLLRTGTETVGVWRVRRDDLKRAGVIAPAAAARLDARVEMLTAFLQHWRRGRGKPLRADDLATSEALSDTFRAPVQALARRLDGDASRLLEKLRAGEVPNFRRAKIGALAAELRESGHVPAQSSLTRAQLLDAVLKRCAPYLRRGALTPEEPARIVAELWQIVTPDGAEAKS